MKLAIPRMELPKVARAAHRALPMPNHIALDGDATVAMKSNVLHGSTLNLFGIVRGKVLREVASRPLA